MKMSRLLILFITVVIVCGCTKENADIRLPDPGTPVVTGYYQRDLLGFDIAAIGNPNVNLHDSNDYLNQTSFFTYPNPSEGWISISIESPEENGRKLLWITPAMWNDQLSDDQIGLNAINVVVGGSPIFQAEFFSDYLAIDLSSLNDGYYRIYLKVNDCLLYDNLVINKLNK